MRVLVIGATGYIASRLIPVLLDAGHDVVAGARSPEKLSRRPWASQVEPVAVDVLDEESVRRALSSDIRAVVYLVHGMAGDDFRDADAAAAANVVEELRGSTVDRLVYLSGLIPDVDRDELSEHLVSRLEVEEKLSEAAQTVITLRAAMVIGAASTSFELMAQLTRRLPVTVIPKWMNHAVEPISVADVARAIAGALTAEVGSGHYDVGGGERIDYPDLLALFAEVAGISREQVEVPLLPEPVVSRIAARITDIDTSTAESLIESLQEDMVARDARWVDDLVTDPDFRRTPVAEAIERSLADPATGGRSGVQDLLAPMPGDLGVE